MRWRGAAVLRGSALLALAALALSCGGGTLQCKKDPVTGSEQCQRVSSSGGEAAANAGAAAATWAVAGCRINGCVGPYRCNDQTAQCDPIACSEAKPCPAPYQCDLVALRCR